MSSTEGWVLWEDEALLAVNKPAGLPTLPDGYNREAAHVKSLLDPAFGRLWIVHRLDKDTSGVLLLARSAQAHRSLNAQFESRQVVKTYHALVLGEPDWVTTTCDFPLRVDGDRRHRTLVDSIRGKEASTSFQRLELFGGISLVEARPGTGRTHQIRAHLTALGYPLVGDVLYGGSAGLSLSGFKAGFSPGITGEHTLIERAALHALSIKFTHPQSEERLCLEAPYAQDFDEALQQLRRSKR